MMAPADAGAIFHRATQLLTRLRYVKFPGRNGSGKSAVKVVV